MFRVDCFLFLLMIQSLEETLRYAGSGMQHLRRRIQFSFTSLQCSASKGRLEGRALRVSGFLVFDRVSQSHSNKIFKLLYIYHIYSIAICISFLYEIKILNDESGCPRIHGSLKYVVKLQDNVR